MSARAARRSGRAARARTPRGGQRGIVAGSVLWRELALLLVCVELAVLILVFDPALRSVFDLPKAVFSHALAWVLLGVLVVVGLLEGIRIPTSPLFIAFYAVVGAQILTTITATNQYVALNGEVGRYLGLTTHTVLALIAVAIGVSVDYPRRVSWLAWTVPGLSVLAGLYAIQQRLGADPVTWTDQDPRLRPFATFGNPDFYGQFLAVVAMGCAAFLAFAGRAQARTRVAVAVLAVFTLALMVIVATRGSLVGVLAGAIVLGVYWLRRVGLSRSTLVRFGAAAAVFTAALTLVVIATPLGARLTQLGQDDATRARLLIYDSATRMFIDHPLVGVGFENFAVVYPRYQQAEWFRIAGANTTNTSAHSWILHTAATSGLVGLAANLALLGAAALHAWQRARDADATGLLVTAVATAAFYGSGLVLPGAQSIQWIPWACIGVALASDLRTSRAIRLVPPLRLPTLVRVVVPLALAAVALTQLTTLTANRSSKSSEVALSAGEGARAVASARTATAIDPGRAVYWNDLGRALELLPDPVGARAAYIEATSRSPYTAAFWWNLARMQQELARRGDQAAREAAYEAMRRAIAAGPENSESFDRLARVQYALGDYEGAIASERQAIAYFATDAGYYSLASEAARQLRDTERSLEFLRQGVANTNSNDLRVALARGLSAAGRITDARMMLREVLSRDPSNASALELQREIGAQ